MISSISPVLAKFVGANRHTNPMRKTLKYKFNAKLQESHLNLSNFIQDNVFMNRNINK